MVEIKKLIDEIRDKVIQMRRDLHQIPETAFTEEKTSEYIAEYLKSIGYKPKTKIAKTGVMAELKGMGEDKTLLLRSDIDALPIKEETGLPFASKHEGKMHACGHDGHMAMLLGAATILGKLRDRINGTIKFVFQPAEEGPGGAKPMIDEGVMENPKVDYSLGCHLWPTIPEGKVGVKAGELMAAVGKFDIDIIGKGGHGAMPHLCVDALEVGTQVVSAMQRIVSRHINPLKPAVVTVGSFHSGSAFNIIAEKAMLSGTTRTFDRDIWDSWEDRLNRVIKGVCDSMGAKYKMDYWKGYPPTINDEFMANVVKKCAIDVVGEENVIEPEPTMGGEDMAYFLERSKGCYYFLGVGREGSVSLHNPKFTFNEDVLFIGIEIYLRAVLELLK